MNKTTIKACVAVVDDDDSVCRSLARLLRASGFQPVTYRSAEAFLEDAQHSHFDCLMLDIQLEGMTGFELQERLASSGSETPVIFITAVYESEVYERALGSGCAAVLRKSDPGEVLLEALRRVAHRSEYQK